MGIQGLLPLLKSIMNPIHIKELEGCFVAIDTYSWLHKGALSCSTDLCKGKPTSKHIDYCMHRVNMLRHYGVKPILVFDGGHLPMKNDQEIKRARSRKENLSRAVEHESNGNLTAAYECYQKAVDISPSVAYDLIQVLKRENILYVVAPYEADAQMTFLALGKHVDAVITEDSDLIAFGCPRIIYKMDKFGQGVEFKNAMLQHNKELNLAGFTQTMLLEMCILSGCDYLASLPGMGLKKAHALIKKFKSHENVIKHLRYNSVEVPPLYEESFRRAILTFRHQRVYDPISEDIVHLSEPVDFVGEDVDFLGPALPQHVAKGIAQGDLDPFTKIPIQTESGATEKVVQGTYQLKNFKPDGDKKKLDLPAQKNLLTNYFCFASLEAKRKFRAPRISPKQPNESNETSSHSPDVKDDLKFIEARDREPWDKREVAAFTVVQNSVCKPCISLHKDLNSDRKNGKATTYVKQNGVVRSSYFLKKSGGENGKENEPLSPLLEEEACRKEEKTVRVDNLRMKQNFNFERENEEICVSGNNENTLQYKTKKRKIDQTDSPIQEDANGDNWTSSGGRSSEAEEGKLGCDISHLSRYSDIAEKSMEKFVSVISSFRYNPSGTRASGLRPPLKDINNNSLRR
ncbi:hypothetical protein ABFS82_13G090100 [Erythranthe guttata]|uniref:Exonuclease 1 n=1 Tax=Erythranthe guttata TaxID=4155 RepID=A0A022QHH5_ERYGU|nr:PREDICTED: exonuclease 1 [Erythranthe guttata]EYU28152.1 hypothetical protein MIMGU_mgv1a002866mg [Erythranthe guttata]|eukprot:XP_012849364.1 PREDICTED: exonuclease 1 [Erythranthe guttata]